MSSACTLIMVGGASPVSEILLPSKTAKFPFLTMGQWRSWVEVDARAHLNVGGASVGG